MSESHVRAAGELLARLAQVDRANAGASESDRLQSLASALDQALERVPASDREPTVREARDQLVRESRRRAERAAELEGRVSRLGEEVATLEAENRSLRQDLSRTAGPPHAAEELERLRVRVHALSEENAGLQDEARRVRAVGGEASEVRHRLEEALRERETERDSARARVAELEAENRALQRAARSAPSDASRVAGLEARVAELQAENSELASGPPAGAAASGGGDGWRQLEQALGAFLGGEGVDAALARAPGEARDVLRALILVLRHAMEAYQGMNALLAELGIGALGDMDTVLFSQVDRGLQHDFQELLDGRTEALEAMQSKLQRARRFVVELAESYAEVVPEAVKAALAELDPQPILAAHKGMLGRDHAAAYKELARRQSDLASLTRTEVWERFAGQLLTEKLGKRLG